MAPILPFLLLLLPFFTLSLPTQTPTLRPNNLLQKTCNATTYYDFCISSLSSSPQTPTATSIQSLSTIAITIAISNATNTSSFASASALSKTSSNPSVAALLRTCADKYARAREALESSLDALSEEEYDYAFVHVSAAAEYPNVCRVLFRRSTAPGVVYPPGMARREVVMERLCTVALDIISLLG